MACYRTLTVAPRRLIYPMTGSSALIPYCFRGSLPPQPCSGSRPSHMRWHSPRATSKRWATSTTPYSSATDPAENEARQCFERGSQKLEEGDLKGAKLLYKRSVEVKRNAINLFNLGVTHYYLEEYDEAIAVWNESIELQPSHADTHMNLAMAYMKSPFTPPDLVLHHISIASSLSPDDPDMAFAFASVMEAAGRLEEALTHYKRSKQLGLELAAFHIDDVSAKLLAQKGDRSQKPDS